MLANLRRLLFNPAAILIAFLALSALVGASYELGGWPFADQRTLRERYRTVRVARTELEPSLKAPGRVESSKQTIIRCALENISSGATSTAGGGGGAAASGGGSSTLISLVPEGTVVKKGDILARLDGSNYEEMLRQQRIVVEQAKASLLQAQLVYEIAQIAFEEYIKGTVHESVQQMEADLSLARSNLTLAGDRLEWTKMMNKKGYASVAQIKTDEQTFLTSELALQKQEGSYDLFQRFTLPKTQMSLKADITTAQTNFDTEQVKMNRQRERFALLERQVARCTIRAPHDGVVYYYFDPHPRRSSQETAIEEGMSVRQEQKLFYFPDLTDMEVQVTLNESIVSRVHPGLAGTVEFEAFPGLVLPGKLESISEIPNQENRRGEDVRCFMGVLKLDHSADGLKPGMSAIVNLTLARREDVLAVPHAAVVADRGRYDCYVVSAGDHVERREVKVGKTTPELIEIIEGLQEGEELLLDPPGRDLTRPRSLAGFDGRTWSDIALNKGHSSASPTATRPPSDGGRRGFGGGQRESRKGGQGNPERKNRKRAAPEE